MNSNELRKQAESEENDLKAMGLYTKVLREERAERFVNYKDKLLQTGYNLTEFEAQGKFTIEPTKFGIVDYYPKSNKVLIRRETNDNMKKQADYQIEKLESEIDDLKSKIKELESQLDAFGG